MATLMCNMTGKAARALIWLVMLVLVFQRVFPFILSNSLHLWILIKRRKFIYLILNFIIISILISSSSFTPHITKLFLKLQQQKSKLQKLLFHDDDNGFYHTQNIQDPPDDDTWWLFRSLDHQPITTATTATNTAAEVDEKEQNHAEKEKEATKEVEEEIVEDDSLEATWKAIMESKEKENGKQLKKSDTWSYGDGGAEERRREKMGLSKYKVRGRLKKWQSFRDMIEKKEMFSGRESGGGGGGKRGWMNMEVALTFHDELKKRADAFIARFTHDIQLQRLESDQRFLEMINRGL